MPTDQRQVAHCCFCWRTRISQVLRTCVDMKWTVQPTNFVGACALSGKTCTICLSNDRSRQSCCWIWLGVTGWHCNRLIQPFLMVLCQCQGKLVHVMMPMWPTTLTILFTGKGLCFVCTMCSLLKKKWKNVWRCFFPVCPMSGSVKDGKKKKKWRGIYSWKHRATCKACTEIQLQYQQP